MKHFCDILIEIAFKIQEKSHEPNLLLGFTCEIPGISTRQRFMGLATEVPHSS